MRLVWRAARADLWPLIVTACVVALSVWLTVVVPAWLTDRADLAIQLPVERADPPAELTVTSKYGPGYSNAIAGAEDTTRSVDDVARQIGAALPPSLGAVLGPPVAAATSTDLQVSTPKLLSGGVMWMSYLWAGKEPAVRWVSGMPPGPPGPDGAVQLGLSDAVAGTLGLSTGDSFTAAKPDHSTFQVQVTGVFEPQDTLDPVWQAVPEILRPSTAGQSVAPTTVVGGLLSSAALPAARAALEPDGVTRTFHFPVEPQALDYASSGALVTQLAALEAAPAALTAPGPPPRVTSQLTSLVLPARERVAATWAQANVVLAGQACAALLVILVAAELLARRRSGALRTVRARGASLVGIAARAGAESAVVVCLGTAVGVSLGVVMAPGERTWLWVAFVVIAGVLAPPAFATLTAARATVRRVPTDRRDRHRLQRVRTVRRVSFEIALVVVAVAALATLRRRGAASISGLSDQLLSAAPVLVAVAGALLLWRAGPPLLAGVLRVARRSRQAGPLLAAARVRSTGSALPFVALVVVITLAALCAALAGTARVGQVDGSWESVGADALVQTRLADPSLSDVAGTISRADGVDAVAVGRVRARSQVYGVGGVEDVRVLAVDPAAYGELLAKTPFGSAPQLAVLANASSSATNPASPVALPALVPAQLLGTRPKLRWGDATIDLEPVGSVPDLPNEQPDGSAARPTVVVDRAALTVFVTTADATRSSDSAEEQAVDPDTVWVVGPRAAEAARTAAAPSGARVIARAERLADRRSDPMAGGLLQLLSLVATVCAGLAIVVVVLDAAASAPGRGRSLAMARVLGMRRKGTARVAAGELLPPTLLAGVGGLLIGMLLAGAIVAPLALRQVTGQSTDPGVVLPWWASMPVALLAATVLLVVAVEASARRRESLGEVLRVR